MNIAFPGHDARERERHAVAHLARVLPAAEANGLTSWWFIRKGSWRVRYLTAEPATSRTACPVHRLLTRGVDWTGDIYEPEIHAFGGPAGMDSAHGLFHADSRHLLSFLSGTPTDRRERSLILCTAFMRAAGLELEEQGDVWARIAERRAPLRGEPPATWASFTGDVRRLLLGKVHPDAIAGDWLAAFEEAGRQLKDLRERGRLTRGIRAVTAHHVIFHWNRIGLMGATQAVLAQAAKEAILGADC
ncbi:thiopeptide-type bacteriocin biosynthesis protein [Actinomadura sp. NBRC 104425]|uniref:thiopeptide-type bacteriocin biosynthesis protein n=1 Tax=Actinomadura sp. NBRC 104425 TaxID=3032204 RepID=UPI002554B2C5|nr:thiopeptide-type bacteriocin biosynthesis protein [Actinomadura sp. NBRC 104425]